MAQATKEENEEKWTFKFNAAAQEFVPRAHSTVQVPMPGYLYPFCQYADGTSGNWIYVTDKESAAAHSPHKKHYDKENDITDEMKRKIMKQAEYMFSDLSLLANESLAKHVSKDPEGFVPINFITTTKKLKSLNVTNQMVAKALMSSPHLVVSSDGKRVRRKLPFTEKDKEELQMRTVIGENLPDDHSHQKIEKLFNVVGSVKSIRICQPQDPNSCRSCSSKTDVIISNKLHALVEYDNAETAEKAAEKLNDDRDWRKGMRVRVMVKRTMNILSKSFVKSRRSLDGNLDEEEWTVHQQDEYTSLPNSAESSEIDNNSGASKRVWLLNRAKPKRTSSLPTSSSNETSLKQTAKGPRMPDGTKGFTMGRGKPLCIQVEQEQKMHAHIQVHNSFGLPIMENLRI